MSTAGQSLALQREAIRRVLRARARQWHVRWYEEKTSGKTLARPELDRLRRHLREGRVATVAVYRLDRLTRSGIRDTLAVVEEIERYGAELVTCADGFDPSGPARDVVVAVLAWAAQIERLAITERIRAAYASVKAKGGHWGRRARMGPSERAQANELRAQGLSLRRIAATLKIPLPTLARTLRRFNGTMAPEASRAQSDRRRGAHRRGTGGDGRPHPAR